ncbi:NADPH:quinone reductase-like Zn-dependent oxidoreductase [Agromyces flavus]|uniref:NADPH:quinone reductase n=1 Tax=Agromyces flavus TaxID=589382 RepID=A0A1H1MSP2_9MICO|nr:NADP-dependent oxidoreductase [Agromyces flavus]MCP2369215.1 NADPH:quinone reductase-like Zn-dependent oxidoreductase [Agromyces flavus]GGI48696.1 NADPH:quinone reductase [Agromyces flavus]SDR89728.1 NADPH:quinone reductase [Agromyces flavus]
MAQAVRFSEYGGPDVLEVVEIPVPEPGQGEVLVEVVATGISPVESAVRLGGHPERWPVEFPSGQGREFAGIVAGTGPGVTRFRRGEEVMGYVARGAQATHVVVPEAQLLPKPTSLPWEVAGSLYVAGTTALGAVEGLNIGAGDVVVITAAAGGVGCLAAQLAKARGAVVIGTTAPARFDFLRQFGIIPLEYGADLAANVRSVTDQPVTAFLDFLGGQAAAAAELGVPTFRVFTTTDWAAVEDNFAVKLYAGDTIALGRIAQLAAERQIRLPIADVFALADVGDAYRQLDQRDSAGKIVIGMKLVGYDRQKVKPARLKEQDVTIGVPTPHTPLSVEDMLPPVIGDGRARQLRHGEEPHPRGTPEPPEQ